MDFIERQVASDTPFFVWMNTTHMHLRTHTKPESLGQAGRWQSEYHDTMIDHDKNVGQLLDKLDELSIAENTIVLYTTDNGPHMNTWPDGAMTPFRNEKNSNWEGAYGFPRSSAGRARFPRVSSPTRSSSTTTGCRPSWPPPAILTSSTSSRPGIRSVTRASRSTSTASTCCRT
jgi:arylsulfatase A-like enzyme